MAAAACFELFTICEVCELQINKSAVCQVRSRFHISWLYIFVQQPLFLKFRFSPHFGTVIFMKTRRRVVTTSAWNVPLDVWIINIWHLIAVENMTMTWRCHRQTARGGTVATCYLLLQMSGLLIQKSRDLGNSWILVKNIFWNWKSNWICPIVTFRNHANGAQYWRPTAIPIPTSSLLFSSLFSG